MKTRSLGKTGIRVSEIAFGTWPIGGDVTDGQYSAFSSYGPADDDLSRGAIHRALELGVRTIDTADVFGHGHSEAIVGEVLEKYPHSGEVKVIAKGGINFYRKGEIPEPDFTPYAIANAVQHSRMRLKRDRLDIYLLMNPPVEILDEKEYVLKTLESLQNAGFIGAFGVCAESAEHAVAVLNSSFPVDVIQVPISLFDQAALVELLPLARKKRVGVLAREPLANGFLSGKYSAATKFTESDMRASLPDEYRSALCGVADQLVGVLAIPNRTLTQAALRFVLDQAGVSSVIVGMRSAEQVDENVLAADMADLTEDERLAIHHAFFPEDDAE